MQILKSLLKKILGDTGLLDEGLSLGQVMPTSLSRLDAVVEEDEQEPSEATWLIALSSHLDLCQQNAENPKLYEQLSASSLVSSDDDFVKKTMEQFNSSQSYLEELSAGFNKLVDAHNELNVLHVTSARYSKRLRRRKKLALEAIPYSRLTCGALSLIVTGAPGAIEIFELPADQLFFADAAEIIDKRRLLWNLSKLQDVLLWCSEGLPLDLGARKAMLKQLFVQFVKDAWQRQRERVLAGPPMQPRIHQEQAVSVEKLIEEKQNLVNKLLSRDEELTSTIARDLHDVIIAEIMLLKSRLVSDPSAVNKSDIIEVLDRLTKGLREICYNLTPRDLADWGLKTVLEDLAHRFAKQNESNCLFHCAEHLPAIEHVVELQLYRIVQEGLSNAAKYADAKNVSINFTSSNGILYLSVEDDGKGFEVDEVALKRGVEGGSGLQDLKVRTELIRCFHPARLAIVSERGRGTKVSVEINLVGN